MHVRSLMHARFWWENQKERDQWEDLSVRGRILLKLISEEWDGVVWTRLIWLRIGTGGGLLCPW
jgi:hypothetical protein